MRRPLFLFASALLLLSTCVQDSESVERGERSATHRVLVAGPRSDFKLKVLERAAATLGVKEYYFKAAGLDALATGDADAFGAIVVIYSMPGGRMDERVSRFLEKHPHDPRVIVFYTKTEAASGRNAGDLEASENSAALLKQADQYADQLALLIRKRFE